jgi:small subunit ribosomal protein S8|tara:strand:- start:1892 stop:2272 length:381 start_codon:yes stop_codon:yes gene_type:complete
MNLFSDFTSRLRNSQKVKKDKFISKKSKLILSFSKALLKKGYIRGIEQNDEFNFNVLLKYTQSGFPVIRTIKLISKPGCRVYMSKKELAQHASSSFDIFLTTNKGILTHIEALKQDVGGEVLCIIN